MTCQTAETTPGIGHNSNALGRGWRRYAWKKARKDLVAARVPLEIVRIRVRRAQRLGLTYPQYASVLLGSGRDIVGFLFTVNGLHELPPLPAGLRRLPMSLPNCGWRRLRLVSRYRRRKKKPPNFDQNWLK